MAVSYTHLAVYKRQAQGSDAVTAGIKTLISAGMKMAAGAGASYTCLLYTSKGMGFAFKPKNLPFTLGITVLSAVAGTLLTLFVFPGLFSRNTTVNAAYGGLAVSLQVTTAMNIVIGFLQKKKGFFAEIASVGRMWFEMFGKKISRKERIYAVVLSVCGLVLGCFFSHPFMLLLAVSLWFFAIAGEQGQMCIRDSCSASIS